MSVVNYIAVHDERLLLVIGAINAGEIILKVQHQPTRDEERHDGQI